MFPSADPAGGASLPPGGRALSSPPSPTARLRRVRHESVLGRWETVWRRPRPDLRRFVAGYLGYDERGRGFRLRRELPSGLITLVVGFEPSVRVLGGEQPCCGTGTQGVGGGLRRQVFVTGVQDRYRLTETAPVSSGVLVRFTPVGARFFLGLPMHLLANRAVGAEELLDAALLRRLTALAERSGWEERFTVLDTLLSEGLVTGSAGGAPSPAERAWEELRRCGGRVAVRDLAEGAGCSHKHLIDQFREQIGLPPKALSQVLRFRTAVGLINSGASLADIALTCGYADQSHLSRAFSRYAGRSPSAFSRTWLPDGGGLRAD
ncbi:helix-turn-helix domain-containing protein [Streptomyces sp. NPDC021100]|uniref:helix-turn-helix domain-containing protein n=1 Tax=Streptomyces sp. NPDC021100 TaxID=3365114 RepID=UPI00378E2033